MTEIEKLQQENKQLKAKVKELELDCASADRCSDHLSEKLKETQHEVGEYQRQYLDVCGEIGEKDRQIAILKSSKDCLVDTVKILQQQLRDQKQQIVEKIKKEFPIEEYIDDDWMSRQDFCKDLDELLNEKGAEE